MLSALSRWILVVAKEKTVVMRLPLSEGSYLLGRDTDAELRLLDIEGSLDVRADEVLLHTASKTIALQQQDGFKIGEHRLHAERTHVASGLTQSLVQTVASLEMVIVVAPNGEEKPLGTQELRIGSDPQCDIVLASGFVSQLHCAIFRKGKRVLVRDLASKNGTFLNDVRIVEAELSVPAVLKVGNVTLQVRGVETDVRRFAPFIVGQSPKMQAVLRDVARYAAMRAPVLVLGETGTGKELVARALHEASNRAQRPFVAVNCGAMASDRLESELFGHVKGHQGGERRDGAFMLADHGTLFLDEVAELPVAAQAALLRALDTSAVKALGGDAPRKVDVRIIAATHRNLEAAVKRGAFREDLYHRLAALTVELPPLRDRREDLPLLVAHFLQELGPKERALKLSSAASIALQAHPFHGNVRELRNAVTRGILEADTTGVIGAKDLGLTTGDNLVASSARVTALASTEREAIINAIRAAKGSRFGAARALGIARSTLYRKLEEHAISDAEIGGTKR